MNNQHTNIFIYGFPAPISTNCKITNILLQHKIKQDTGWTIKNGAIHYIIGKIWNNETLEFEPGRGATITIEEALTQNNINIINNTKDDTRDIYSITYYLASSDIGNLNSMAQPSKRHTDTPTSQKSDLNKFKYNILNDLNNEIQENIKYNQNINNINKIKHKQNTQNKNTYNSKNQIINTDPSIDLATDTYTNPSTNPTTANDNNTIDHTDESPLETSTQYTIGKKLNENNNSSKIYPQTRTYQIPQIRKCTQFETENKYGKVSPSTTTNDINGSKSETAHYTIPSGTIFKAILDNKTRGETLNIENKINEESVLSHPNDKKLTKKFKKKLGSDKKSYSPSPIEETPHSNLIHTETHSNIPHKTAAIPNSNNPITQNNYAIMRALTHYIYYFLCIIIYLLSTILSTLSYMNNKILARATHGALVSRPNGEKLIEKQNPSLADIKVTLTPNLYLLNGKNENILNNTCTPFLLTLIITPLISFHSQ